MAKTPVQKTTKAETFKLLCEDFSLNDKVLKLIMDSPMETLEDMRFWFVEEDEFPPFLATDKSLKGQDLALQVARLRRAWTAIRQCATTREQARSQVEAADLDDILEEVTLRDVKLEFGSDIA